MDEELQIGKWLEFDAGTCFGITKRHLGVLVGIDYDEQMVVVAVNATSQLEKLIKFADLNNIPVQDAMVDVTDDTHFTKPTGLDCHRPKEIPLSQLQQWISCCRIRKSNCNEDLAPEKLQRAIEIILNSPLVEPKIKHIVQKSISL